MTKPLLQLTDISLSYGSHKVIQHIDLSLQEGEIACLLGSSGCGKTTLLRSIAGFEIPDKGRISLRGKSINDKRINIPPEQRNIGMVFQDFALFPHLSIKKNIAFGLNKQSKKAVSQRVNELLELIGMGDIEHKYPHQLSGGQQQRVALARALAAKPDLLLLDEPFSSLDVTLREQIATEVRKIIKHEGISAILVTHDQQEAFAMADKVGLLHQGEMIQWDTPYNLYHKPASRYAAHFIGQGVMLPARVLNSNSIQTELGIIHTRLPDDYEKNCPVEILIRPDDIIYNNTSDYQLEIIDKIFRGAEFLYTLKVNDNSQVLCITPSHQNHALNSLLGISLDIKHSVIFKQ